MDRGHGVGLGYLIVFVGWIGFQDEDIGGRKDTLELGEQALMPHSIEGLSHCLKKLLHLTSYTPSYIFQLGTKIQPIFIHTLKLHLMFMHKIMNLPYDRAFNTRST